MHGWRSSTSQHEPSVEGRPTLERIEQETARIIEEYARREREIPPSRYSLSDPGARFLRDSRVTEVHRLLERTERLPFGNRVILDIGCGRGDWLVEFEFWGARRDQLAGIDLIPARVQEARARLGSARTEGPGHSEGEPDIRTGNATDLPWGEGAFDLVVLSTMLSSILDEGMRRVVASEAARVLKPSGAVLWYDFFFDNPRNRAVRGVRRREVEQLFPGFSMEMKKITLAPPLARWLAPRAEPVAVLLDKARLFSTHLLGLLVKTG
jgi:ubiquinone/menaquinone biosynthesis C-methylase UbiE